jgi:hypothetical protein
MHRVGHAGGHGDGHDLVVEQAGLLRGAGLLLAAGAVVVHALAWPIVVALGHVLGRLQHVPVDLGLVLHCSQGSASMCWFISCCTQEMLSTPPAT